MNNAKFITFEGADGVGKSLQINLLAERLQAQGHCVHLTREPGGTELGEQLRHLILSTPHLSPETQCTLFVGARAHHVQTVILPALAQGKWVLCDRFIHSTLVYQGILGGVDLDFIYALHENLKINIRPGLTFVLEADIDEGYKRCQHRSQEEQNVLDPRSIEHYHAVQNAYKTLAFENTIRIPANTIQSMQQCIDNHMLNHIQNNHITL